MACPLNFQNEGYFVLKPPFFNYTNFNYWKSIMNCFLKFIDYYIWYIIMNGDIRHIYALPIVGARAPTKMSKKNY